MLYRPSRFAGIHLLVAGSEDDVHAGLTAQFEITFQVAGIFGKILLRPELRGVDVNAHHHDAVFAGSLPGTSDEAQVAGMQKTHRRHKPDAPAGTPPLSGQTLHRGEGTDNSHGGRLTALAETNKPRRRLCAAWACSGGL